MQTARVIQDEVFTELGIQGAGINTFRFPLSSLQSAKIT
jgi:hypothetical protein